MARESKIRKIVDEFDLAMKQAAENFTENHAALMEMVRSNSRPENGEEIAENFMYYLNEVFIGSHYIIERQQTAAKNKQSCEMAAKILGAEIKTPERA